MSGKNFALIGAAGYVAPRHMEAIRSTGNNLVAALDKNDSVGIIDRYFPEADFFTEFERFDRHLEKLKQQGTKIDYISICSPNYLHDAHIRFALRYGADAICEKPLVLNPWNLDALKTLEEESGKKVKTIFQVRLHPSIISLKEKIDTIPSKEKYNVELTYITPRGNWYYTSWKGDDSKSGGISTNIGVHFFDLLTYLFGGVEKNEIHLRSHDRAAGYLSLERAEVKWFLSINGDILKHIPGNHEGTYRSIKVNSEEIEFSGQFTDLHIESYRQITAGKGFGIDDARLSTNLVHSIRKLPIATSENMHPLGKVEATPHPFQREG